MNKLSKNTVIKSILSSSRNRAKITFHNLSNLWCNYIIPFSMETIALNIN